MSLLAQGDEPIGIAGGSPRAGQPALPEPRFEGSPRGRLGGPRGSLSPRQGSQPRTTPTGRAAPDSQVWHLFLTPSGPPMTPCLMPLLQQYEALRNFGHPEQSRCPL